MAEEREEERRGAHGRVGSTADSRRNEASDSNSRRFFAKLVGRQRTVVGLS